MSVRVSIIWLKIACIMTIGTGVICAMASHSATDFIWLYLFDLLKWPLDGNPAGFHDDTRAVNAVLGGTMVGWGLLMYVLSSKRVLMAVSGLPRMMLIALIAWFLVDCIGSLLAGLPGNLLLNIGFLVLFVPPLLYLNHRTKSVA
jgi:hypothetical protein